MITSSSILNNLIEELSKLPGVGRKSAARLAYHIINMDEKNIESLVNAIDNASKNVKHCKICNSLSDDDVCNICSDIKRDKEIIMVVENERDLEAYESVGKYRGLYHVLGGALSPLIGIGPNELKIKELIARLDSKVKEVIIMLDTMGELSKMFSVCYAAFIGGSFSQTGGHNPLEANIWDKPVVSGPSISNFKDIYRSLTKTKAAFIVHNQSELIVKLSELLTDKEFYAQACEDAAKIFRENSGAVDFALNEIKS